MFLLTEVFLVMIKNTFGRGKCQVLLSYIGAFSYEVFLLTIVYCTSIKMKSAIFYQLILLEKCFDSFAVVFYKFYEHFYILRAVINNERDVRREELKWKFKLKGGLQHSGEKILISTIV